MLSCMWIPLLSAEAAGEGGATATSSSHTGLWLQWAALPSGLRAVPFEVPSDWELFLKGRVEC